MTPQRRPGASTCSVWWAGVFRPRRQLALAAGTAGAFLLFAVPHNLVAHDRITTKVTWNREIAPIFNARCADCHRPGGRSKISLTTYQEARPWAVAIKEEVLTRRMPKWSAARGYGEFANDPSLSPFETALIAAWVDGGAPESGDRNKPTLNIAPTIPPVVPFTPPRTSAVHTTTRRCGEEAASGRLLAVRPTLDKGGAAGIAALLPGGRREIVAWVRNYDPDYPTTYWLRKPLVLPSGSRLRAESDGTCTLEVTFAR